MTQACIVWVQKKELVSREHENRRGNKGTWIQEYKEWKEGSSVPENPREDVILNDGVGIDLEKQR